MIILRLAFQNIECTLDFGKQVCFITYAFCIESMSFKYENMSKSV